MKAFESFLLCVVLICISFAAFVGYVHGVDAGVNRMQKEAIERGYADHEARTGRRQWKGEAAE